MTKADLWLQIWLELEMNCSCWRVASLIGFVYWWICTAPLCLPLHFITATHTHTLCAAHAISHLAKERMNGIECRYVILERRCCHCCSRLTSPTISIMRCVWVRGNKLNFLIKRILHEFALSSRSPDTNPRRRRTHTIGAVYIMRICAHSLAFFSACRISI